MALAKSYTIIQGTGERRIMTMRGIEFRRLT
jgi:hypothetical protein